MYVCQHFCNDGIDAPSSIERQLLYVQTSLDTLDEELTTEDIISRERNIDKELILLVQAACKSDDAPRAIELVKLLHHLPSFDAAIKIAGFYHLLGLQEKLEVLKSEREEAEDRLEVLKKKRKRWLRVANVPREVDYSSTTTGRNGGGRRYDPLGDTGPPPMIERPGMSRVEKPFVERTRFSSIITTTQAQSVREDDASLMVTRSPSPNTWDDSELAVTGASLNDDNTYNPLGGGEELGSMTTTMAGTAQKRKRNDVDDIDVSQFSDVSVMPPKQSTFCTHFYLCMYQLTFFFSN
jgi:chromosome transmission fidelity protein 4